MTLCQCDRALGQSTNIQIARVRTKGDRLLRQIPPRPATTWLQWKGRVHIQHFLVPEILTSANHPSVATWTCLQRTLQTGRSAFGGQRALPMQCTPSKLTTLAPKRDNAARSSMMRGRPRAPPAAPSTSSGAISPEPGARPFRAYACANEAPV